MTQKKTTKKATSKIKKTKKEVTKTNPLVAITKINSLKDLLKGETLHFLIGLVFLCLAVFVVLAFISYTQTAAEDQDILDSIRRGIKVDPQDVQNQAGYLGLLTSHFFIDRCYGISSFFIPLFLFFAAMALMRAYKVHIWRKFLNFAFLMIWTSIAITFFLPISIQKQFAFSPGGAHGTGICEYLESQIGQLGLFILLTITAIFYLIYLSKRTIIFIRKAIHPFTQKEEGDNEDGNNESLENEDETDNPLDIKEDPKEFSDPTPVEIDLTKPEGGNTEKEEANLPTTPFVSTHEDPILPSVGNEDIELTITETTEEEEADDEFRTPYDPKLDLEYYKYPALSLLKKYEDNGQAYDIKEQTANKNRITTILHNFGVEISSIKATVGPTITLYEITPSEGVRISKIKNLEDDIALSLSALGIRIIAPIPGKGTIGIEVPNKNPKIVSIESILNSKKFQETTYELPIALGKTITNEVYMVDLAKMPHLLVAGATGQGKSVGLNAIITSLIYKKHPSELKFVLVDPKKVEFSVYAPLEKHFLAKIPDDSSDPIITDVTKVVQTLKSLCQEMDDRYLLLKSAHCRNVKEYNQKFIERHLNPDNGHRYLPYIVVIIDEFGDLIMTAGKEVELPIARIAQLARAVGIHMVIATQRPTTNIITGTIKANFPARMAFRVMAQIDSRTILDQGGANQLIGKGDMLFLAGSTLPTRVQCAFIDTPEVERINNFISEQQSYLCAYELPEVVSDESSDGPRETDPNEKLDPLFEEAARLIVIHQQGSTSLIQRKFAIGYNRAGRLMDQLERMGIVGSVNGSKPREVLCSDENSLQTKLDSLNLQS